MHSLASFKLYVFHEVVVCFISVATPLTFGFPMFSQIQVSGRLCPGRQVHHIQILKNVQNLYDRHMQDVYCIHVFLSLLMIYLQQSRKSMSKAYMCVCLFVCLFVEVLSVSPISLNASAIRRRTHAALESLADS